MATVQTPEGKFGQWNMQRREAKINKWQSDVGMLDEKIDVVKNNIARHTAALQYHQSKGFFRKLFTFAWFSMWWNRRKLDKFNRKSREWIAHKQMIVAKQMIAQRKFEKKYGREVAYGHGGKIVTRINEYGKLEDREANGRTKGQRKVERAEFGYKNADRNVYLSTPSALPEFIAQTKDGKETYHYDHYNSIDRTVEINTNAGIERFVSDPARGLIRYEDHKVIAQLNKNNEIDLSLPENASIAKDPVMLAEVLKQYPEAYKTIPAEYFGRSKFRKDALKAVQEGLNNKLDGAYTDKDGNIVVESPQKDSSGNYTGKKCSPRELAQQIYQDVIDKDQEIVDEGNLALNPTKKTNLEAQRNANKAKTGKNVGQVEVDNFFREATR